MSPAIERTFSTKQLSQLSGASLRQLQYWCEARVLRPRIEGHGRLYSERDLRMVRIVGDLTAKGVRCATIRRWQPRFAKYDSGYLLFRRHHTSHRGWYVRDEQQALQTAANADYAVLLVDLGAAH